MKHSLSRRSAIKTMAGGALAATTASYLSNRLMAAEVEPLQLKGHIKHSVSQWCYGRIPLDEFCQAVKKMGLASVELLGPKDWPVVQKHGLVCAMCNGPDSIGYGFNRVEHHDKLVQGFEKAIPEVAKFGFPNIICFSGNRGGMSDEEGLKNCVQGLKRVAPIAENIRSR
jgi:hydroxypyruvate isomerase